MGDTILYSVTRQGTNNMDIIALKLVSGEDLIAEVEDMTADKYDLKNPLGLGVVPGVDGKPAGGFVPFPMFGRNIRGSQMTIWRDKVAYEYIAADEFVKQYDKVFGSGIILPGSV